MISRRGLLAGAGAVALIAGWRWSRGSDEAVAATFEIEKPDDEWRRLLTPAQYDVLRQHGTERPFTSPLNNEKRTGVFRCAGCGEPLFDSDTKYESGSGWPSFWAAKDDAVDTSSDSSHGMIRTEVTCAKCGGHLGHLFPDGPRPTGDRYCMNGAALKFEEKK